jgi:hypothetical protein
MKKVMSIMMFDRAKNLVSDLNSFSGFASGFAAGLVPEFLVI